MVGLRARPAVLAVFPHPPLCDFFCTLQVFGRSRRQARGQPALHVGLGLRVVSTFALLPQVPRPACGVGSTLCAPVDSARLLDAVRRVYIATRSSEHAGTFGGSQSTQPDFAENEAATHGAFPAAELPRDDIVASLVLVNAVLCQAGSPIFCPALWWPPLQRPRADKGNVLEDFSVGFRVVLVLVPLHIVVAVHHRFCEPLCPLIRKTVPLPSSVVNFVLDGISAPVCLHLDGFQLASVVFLPPSDYSPQVCVRIPP